MKTSTGLGLSTVFGIVKQNHGCISVDSEPEKGTTFRIYLPRTWKKTRSIQKERLLERTLNGNEGILIVEDDERVRKTTMMMLKKCGYTIFTASNGSEALSRFSKYKNSIRLLLTDVIMPDINGEELSMKIKEKCADIKIIYMSGYTDDTISNYGVLKRGINFIQKPFSQKDLALKVRQILDS